MTFEVNKGTLQLTCPDSKCKGKILEGEIKSIAGNKVFEKHAKVRLNKAVAMEKLQMWCPQPDCETICYLTGKGEKQKVICSTCKQDFCSQCTELWHNESKCIEASQDPHVRSCPNCYLKIVKTYGCRRMVCRRCRFIFCWDCMTVSSNIIEDIKRD